MTEKGFEVFPTDSTIFAHQLTSLKNVPFSAIKIEFLPNVEIAEQALEVIQAPPRYSCGARSCFGLQGNA